LYDLKLLYKIYKQINIRGLHRLISQVYMSHMDSEYYSHSFYVRAFLPYHTNNSLCIMNTCYLLLEYYLKQTIDTTLT
jgi:hypothetical protein